MAKVRKDREPLPDIKCGDTKCEDGLHDYRKKRKPVGKEYEGTECHSCGDDSIQWSLFNDRDLSDINLTFETLQKEYIRFEFWNMNIDEILHSSILKKGKGQIEKDVEKRINDSVKLPGKQIFQDGRQTPVNKHNILYFAQHATATCCRKCIRRWHLIPYDKELDKNDIAYLKKIMMAYILKRVPELSDNS